MYVVRLELQIQNEETYNYGVPGNYRIIVYFHLKLEEDQPGIGRFLLIG